MATLPKPLPYSGKFSGAKKAVHCAPKGRQSITASAAKTHLLALIDQVHLDGTPMVITKRGRPLVQIVPISEPEPVSIFGCMKGTFTVTGDIIGPEPDEWDALS